MATEYWIQLENRWWDACPNNLDRMTGQTIEERDGIAPETKTLSSPGTGKSFSREMYKPVEALILRRYKPPVLADESDAWTQPDDRKVNPWDLNEPDPRDD